LKIKLFLHPLGEAGQFAAPKGISVEDDIVYILFEYPYFIVGNSPFTAKTDDTILAIELRVVVAPSKPLKGLVTI